jgi:hypothetical protein
MPSNHLGQLISHAKNTAAAVFAGKKLFIFKLNKLEEIPQYTN